MIWKAIPACEGMTSSSLKNERVGEGQRVCVALPEATPTPKLTLPFCESATVIPPKAGIAILTVKAFILSFIFT